MAVASKAADIAHRTLVLALVGLTVWTAFGGTVLLRERIERKKLKPLGSDIQRRTPKMPNIEGKSESSL
ncbi:hypothetical protein G9A89_023484 [Geosiphon pyriformis]|nr:hypothetical protein G9A89_023484 [Geosiphon pyriformis]